MNHEGYLPVVARAEIVTRPFLYGSCRYGQQTVEENRMLNLDLYRMTYYYFLRLYDLHKSDLP